MNQDRSVSILVYRGSYRKPKELSAFMYANLAAIRHLAILWRREIGEGKRNNLVQCFWRQECVCVLYIASVFTSCYHLLIACC